MLEKKIGNKCEALVANFFKDRHYYAHITGQKIGGQPVDLICIKGGLKNEIVLCDAKHVEFGLVSFTFDRVEPNQDTSMNYAKNYANIENLGFAIHFERDNEIRWLSYDLYLKLKDQGKKSINKDELPLLKEIF